LGRREPGLDYCGGDPQKDTVFHDDTTPHLVYDSLNINDGRPADLADSTAQALIANLISKEENYEPQTLF
jgi:hypothetical protein